MDIDKVIMQRDEMLKLLIQMDELLLKWDSKGIAPLHVTVDIFDEKVRKLRDEVEAQVQLGMAEGKAAMLNGKRCEEPDTGDEDWPQTHNR